MRNNICQFFYGRTLTTDEITIVKALETISTPEHIAQLKKMSFSGSLIRAVSTALFHYTFDNNQHHIGKLNRMYRAHCTQENGPQYVLDHMGLNTIKEALDVIREIIKHVKNNPENARIASSSRIHYLLKQLQITTVAVTPQLSAASLADVVVSTAPLIEQTARASTTMRQVV